MIKKDYFKTTVIYVFFMLLTLLTTYPLIFKIKNHIPGFYSTDEPYAALWNFWWIKYAWVKGLSSHDYSTLAVPFGINYLEFSIYPVWEFINKWLSIFTSNFITYNLEVLLSFMLAGICMYSLAHFLTKSRMCGILSGVIYAFCPYHFARAWQHLGLAQIQWMPLYLLSLLILIKKRNLKNAFIAALCFYLVFAFEFHYAYFMFITTIVLIIWMKNKLSTIKSFTVVAAIILVTVSPVIFAIAKNTANVISAGVKAEYGFVRPFNDLFTQSARPLSYFLPASFHPVFGKFTEHFIGSSLYGESLTEHTLYLGWIPLILAFIAFKRRKSWDSPYLRFFIVLAIVAWFFSQPPWWQIGPIKIYMPSFFMYKILPMFRAYCRFGIVLMLAVAVLAGFGMKFILVRFKSFKTHIFLTCLLSGLVLFEFWNYPPYKVVDLSKTPAAYVWLKNQPGDWAIAEYPLDTKGANVMYMFYQTRHEKKIINGTVPGTYPNKVAKTITKLSDLATARALKWMGVKYVLVHKDDYLKTELIDEIEELNKIPKNPGLRLVKNLKAEEPHTNVIMSSGEISEIDVYEVIANPIKPEIK
ncbi:hypothetical protein D4R78_02100 [bacterium]|nr:MAG: hypothetical protein D4R78_02100 [bacterium]